MKTTNNNNNNTIPSFAVCTAVSLGPLLRAVDASRDSDEDYYSSSDDDDDDTVSESDSSQEDDSTNNDKDRSLYDIFQRKWSTIAKNKDSSDPTKTQPAPDTYSFDDDDDKKKDIARVEAMGCNFSLKKNNETECETNNHNHKNVDPEEDGATTKTQEEEEEPNNIVFCNFDTKNMLAKAVHVAFYKHYPLKLSPDVIWLTIVQGLAKHVDQNPQLHRSQFVNFKQGKKTLVVTRENFVRGSPHNDWTTVFPEFADMVAAFVGQNKVETLSNNFSTTTLTDALCSNIALMDTVKHYFEYEMYDGCGIPSIQLTGTPDDWVKLRQKAKILTRFRGLNFWTKELFPVLDQFVVAAQGSPNILFWKSVCNLFGASGGWNNFVTGWIQVLFPYTNDGERNWSLDQWRENFEQGTGNETEEFNRKGGWEGYTGGSGYGFCPRNVGDGLKLEKIPSGLSQAPVKYHEGLTGNIYAYTFNGGLVAIRQDPDTLALEPLTGWAVLDHGKWMEPTNETTMDGNKQRCRWSKFFWRSHQEKQVKKTG